MREIDIDQAAAALEQGATVVDVREPSEYADGHLPGAVNIPMGQLPGRTDELDKETTTYVVCASGNRSGAMTDFLAGSGFDAVNIAGGTSAWIRAGRPTEK